MLLADIGNSFVKIYDGKEIKRLPHSGLEKFKEERVYYISVKVGLVLSKNWINLEPYVQLLGSYPSMGIDRKVLCIAIEDGVVVDAGSAITVDKMVGGRYEGGFIMPGVKKLHQSFSEISPKLKQPLAPQELNLEKLPKSTLEAVNYGLFVPIIKAIKNLEGALFLTGGDAKLLKYFLPEAKVDEKLIFKGMQKIIKKGNIC